ncbi:MAG: hypothetical protein AABN95_01195 [Acidobacteriota bacterium]
MKTITIFTACMLIYFGAPLSANAKSAKEAFLLPDSRVGEPYQVDVEALLRQRYRLKIDTGTRESILQWFLVEGELPAGLTIRTNGNVVGIPETYRDRPYVFSARVVDQAVANADPLIISLSVVVAPPRLRLTRIEGPALVPVDNPAPTSGGNGPKAPDVPPAAAPHRPAIEPVLEVRTKNRLPLPDEVAVPPTEDRGLLSKIVGVMGLQEGRGRPTDPQRCDDSSKARRVVSDEAHNPLEGDTSTQNTCVEFHNLNTLKYRIEFNTKTTRTEGPDLGSFPVLPKLPLTTSTPTTPPSDKKPSPAFLSARTAGLKGEKLKAETKEVEDEFKSDIDRLNTEFGEARRGLSVAETSLREDVEKRINEITTALEDAHANSKALANVADAYLQGDNQEGLLREVENVLEEVEQAIANEWPSDNILAVLTALDDVTARLEDLRSLESEEVWKEWLVANQDRYNRVRDRVTELKNKISSFNSKAFDDGKKLLIPWRDVLKNVHDQKEDAFTQKAFVSCHTDEAESKSSKLTISKTDRTTANATAVTREVLTVNCYSRVAFTAGFNFSTLDEKEFSVVNAAGTESGTTVKKFGFTNRSSFRPNPLALVNIRFTDQPTINWHASFGAVVDLKGQTGTDVEPIAGVSFSIRRLIFITPFALHFGRVNKLAGDFKEGDLVPESIATPPIEKAWKVGYTGGITFRIAP